MGKKGGFQKEIRGQKIHAVQTIHSQTR
jgi:hypothetical protein